MFGCKYKIADRLFWGADPSNAIKAIPAMIVKAFTNVQRHERAFRLEYGDWLMLTRNVAKNEFVSIRHQDAFFRLNFARV